MKFQKTSGRSITNSKILYNIPNELNFLVHGQSVDQLVIQTYASVPKTSKQASKWRIDTTRI